MWAKRKGKKEKKKKVKRTRFPTSREEKSLILNFEFGVPFGFQGCPKFNIPHFLRIFFPSRTGDSRSSSHWDTFFPTSFYAKLMYVEKRKDRRKRRLLPPLFRLRNHQPMNGTRGRKSGGDEMWFSFFLRETYIKSPAAHTKKAGKWKKGKWKKEYGQDIVVVSPM